MSRVDRERFLSQPHVAVLSVAAGPERPPASVPLWYAYEPGGDVVVNTSVTSRKARLIREAGAVTLTVQRAVPPYGYVVVEGEVVDIIYPSPMSARRSIARRYLSIEGADAAVGRYDPDDQVLFVIRPRRWSSADFSGAPSAASTSQKVPHDPSTETGASHDQ